MTIDPLATYNSKRDFAKTREPKGEHGRDAGHLFMVQKHDATRLHWDFRLELDGVLKSWAVTRGPSLDPADKRLAVRTEDHPLSYATFEGTIPKGEYGGGTVMLWDRGTWTPLPGKDPGKTLAEGHLHFTLAGERMKGEWIMIRLKPRGKETRENWLLRKVADAEAGSGDALVERCLTSVTTGRTMDEIAEGKGEDRVWHSDKAEAKRDPREESHPVTPAKAGGHGRGSAKRASEPPTMGSGFRRNDGRKGKRGTGGPPAFHDVQLATLVDSVPTGSGWLHEIKYDGYRALLAIGGGKAKAYTRTGLDWSDRFAPIVEAAAALPGAALIDGEVVVLDGDGRPSFGSLQNALKHGGAELSYFAFDLLAQDGEDLTSLGNADRKARLAALLEGVAPPLHFAEHITGSGDKLFRHVCGEGYEGIVSKAADAPYRGKRSQSWLKLKCTRRQEFVIVGWLPSAKGRGFRSLLLGLNEKGALRYAGKVGTGFDQRLIEEIGAKLKLLARKTPTVDAPKTAVRGAHWVTPKLVAEVAYAEVTGEGVLRHSSFLGLREDKPAKEVVREQAAPAPEQNRRRRPAPSPAHPELVEGSSLSSAARNGKAGLRQAQPERDEDDGFAGVHISNPDRVIFPESKITKGDLAAYYTAMAEPVLRWLADRPVSLVRCPQGRAKHCFFQKHDAGSFGDAVKHVPIREKDGHDEPYLYVDDARGILTCVQMGAIEFHGWGASVAHVERPDRLVFDLDPDEGLDFGAVKRAAVQIKEALADMGLVTFPMLSGGKGIHVIAPLNATAAWPAVKDFADRFSRALAQAHPDRFTANMKKAERKGRIFLDWLRNQRGATAILPWSARARPNAPVAVPVAWSELDGLDGAARWTIADQVELLERAGSSVLKGWGVADQRLPDV